MAYTLLLTLTPMRFTPYALSLIVVYSLLAGEAKAQQCPDLVGIDRAICFGADDDLVLDKAFRINRASIVDTRATITWYYEDDPANPHRGIGTGTLATGADALAASAFIVRMPDRNPNVPNDRRAFTSHENGRLHRVKVTQRMPPGQGCIESPGIW